MPFTEKYVQYRRPRFQRAMRVLPIENLQRDTDGVRTTACRVHSDGQACQWRRVCSQSHGRAIGLSLRVDESSPFVFVYVLRPIPDGAAHFKKARASALEPPRSNGEPGHAQSSRDLNVGEGPLLKRC